MEVPSRQKSSQPGSYPSDRGGDEAVEAWETEGGETLSANWQAVTLVNACINPANSNVNKCEVYVCAFGSVLYNNSKRHKFFDNRTLKAVLSLNSRNVSVGKLR